MNEVLECRECDWAGTDPDTGTDWMCGVKVRFQICPECGSEQIGPVEHEVIA